MFMTYFIEEDFVLIIDQKKRGLHILQTGRISEMLFFSHRKF